MSGCGGTGDGAAAPDGTGGTAAPSAGPAGAQPVTVERVVDGDTLVVRAASTGRGTARGPLETGERARVRLLNVDAPEAGHCYADEATARTGRLLPPGSTARVRADTEPRDRYGRHLVHVWTARGVWVNRELVGDGYARSLVVPPNDARIGPIRAAEGEARAAGAGLWSACGS